MGMHFDAPFWACMAVSALAALAYGLFFLNRAPSLVRALVKTTFMAAMGFGFHLAGARDPFVIALFAAALGDFFLAFDKPWILPLGMLAFLAQQLLYCLTFFALWMLAPDGSPLWPRYALMIATLAMVGGFIVWFWQSKERKGNALLAAFAITGALLIGAAPLVFAAIGYASSFDDNPQWGVWEWSVFAGVGVFALGAIVIRRDLGVVPLAAMLYGAVITQMALASFWLPWAAWGAMLGAILFLVSDGALSAELFKMPADAPARRITAPVVWWTYAGAQALIAWGVICAAAVMV